MKRTLKVLALAKTDLWQSQFSNKERKGIEQVVKAIQEMTKLATIGWSLRGREDRWVFEVVLFRFLVTKCPAVKNRRSTGAEGAGME